MNEIYEERPVVGFEDKYVVSITGKVFSLSYNDTGQKREMVGSKDRNGYHVVSLSRNGKRKCIKTHRVVATAFHDNSENKPCVDHIDGNKANNHASNLRWVTYKENNNNPISRKRVSEAIKGTRKVFTAEHCNNISKSKSKYGVSIIRVYSIIPRDELPLGRRGPVSLARFTLILRTPTDDRYTHSKALFDQYKDVYLENH